MLHQNSLNRQLYNPNSQNLFNHYHQLKLFFDKGAILLDVRTIQEFDRCHLPNARHISSEQLSTLLSYVKGWNLPIIPYSGFGGRSRVASQLLRNANIAALDGGAKETLEILLFNRRNGR